MKEEGQFSIGEVCVAEPSESNSAGFKISMGFIGKPRQEMLKAFRDGVPLPEPYFMVAGGYGKGWKRITREEVYWESCGPLPGDPDFPEIEE